MTNTELYYYTVRRTGRKAYSVALCSSLTGDVKEYISQHNNSANAWRRADKLNKLKHSEQAKQEKRHGSDTDS